MATKRDTVKPWFETGDKPSQTQFWTLFDYLFFQDDAINTANVNGLDAALTAKADKSALDGFTGGELLTLNTNGTYLLPMGYFLEKLIIIPTVDQNISIGKTNGGDEIAGAQLLTANNAIPYEINQVAFSADETIYFNGISATTYIIIFKRKLITIP